MNVFVTYLLFVGTRYVEKYIVLLYNFSSPRSSQRFYYDSSDSWSKENKYNPQS